MGMYTRLTFWMETLAEPVLPSWTGCSSYYHQTGETVVRYDDVAKRWFVNIDCSIKNYSNQIKVFLDEYHYLEADKTYGLRGFFLYEEDDAPTLIYWGKDEYVYIRAEAPESYR